MNKLLYRVAVCCHPNKKTGARGYRYVPRLFKVRKLKNGKACWMPTFKYRGPGWPSKIVAAEHGEELAQELGVPFEEKFGALTYRPVDLHPLQIAALDIEEDMEIPS
jgi:hypothetical protein